jgi:predicted RecB family nuclease
MAITEEIFEAFLRCETKSYLYSQGAVRTNTEFSEWKRHVRETFKQTGWKRLRSAVREGEWYVGTPPLHAFQDRRYRLIIDYTVALPDFESRLHALERIPSSFGTSDYGYIPIRFVSSEKLTTSDKLLLAFDTVALSRTSGEMPQVGKIIHGGQYATATVRLAGLVDKVRSLINTIAARQATSTPPPPVLNKHCVECEFESRCRRIAIEKDDLSLLTTIGEKERRTQNAKGIFTVIQLSYTFRPRRRSSPTLLKHQPALKALAIRKHQIHVLGTPALTLSGTPVYIDVEGDPDRDFYYLIGVRVVSGGSSVHYSFWANDQVDERRIWADCLHTLGAIDTPQLIHYGSYETRFLKRMIVRYPDIGDPTPLSQLALSHLNLLSVIYAHVYFPTYSNGLKEVARYLGFCWSESSASGLTALCWRSRWESSHEPLLKQKLLTYNAEDCEAAAKVADALSAVCRPASSGEMPRADVVSVDSLKREYPQCFGEVEFALREFQQINEAAYWDYQRNKVYVRSNRRLQRLNREAVRRHSGVDIRPNKIIFVEEPQPSSCGRCNDPLIYKWDGLAKPSTTSDSHEPA